MKRVRLTIYASLFETEYIQDLWKNIKFYLYFLDYIYNIISSIYILSAKHFMHFIMISYEKHYCDML